MSAQAKIQLLYPVVLKIEKLRRDFDISSYLFTVLTILQGTVSATKIKNTYK